AGPRADPVAFRHVIDRQRVECMACFEVLFAQEFLAKSQRLLEKGPGGREVPLLKQHESQIVEGNGGQTRLLSGKLPQDRQRLLGVRFRRGKVSLLKE